MHLSRHYLPFRGPLLRGLVWLSLGLGLRIGVGLEPVQAQDPSAASTGPATPPKVRLLRYEEDYRYLRDPARRTHVLDPLKYIPLRAEADTTRAAWFATLGGEVRFFYERYVNENWGAAPPDRSGYLLQRTMLHADAQLGAHVRLFAELKSGLITGRAGGPRPVDLDRLDVNQAFVELRAGRAPAAPDGSGAALLLRLGRQELDFGSGRLISVRALPNVRQGFDGARATLNRPASSLAVFAVRPAETNRGYFDDRTDPTESLWGAYATHTLRGPLHLDLYYLGSDRERAVFAEGRGAETRHTAGGRLWHRTPALSTDLEGTYQFGTFGAGRIRAWSAASSTSYTFGEARFRPALGLNLGLNSGDLDPTDPDNQTYRPPAPRGAYFGAVGANGPPNIGGFAPTLRLAPVRGVTVLAFCYFFWRTSRRDVVYNVPGFPLRPPGPSRARYIGTQPELDAVWQLGRYFSLTGSYAFFDAGPYIRESPPGRDVHYLGSWLTFSF